MVNPQLADYVSKELQANISRDEIRGNLLKQGWPAAEVEAALAMAPSAPLVQAPAAVSPLGAAMPPAAKGMNKKRWIMIGAGVIVLALLIGGGAYAYFGYYLSTDRIMGEARARIMAVKTVQYQGKALFNSSETDSDPATPYRGEKPRKLAVDFSGSANTEKIDNASSYFSINIKGNPLSTDEVTSLGVDMRSIATMMYVKMSWPADEKKNGQLAMLDSFNDKWYSLDIEALRKQYGGAVADQLAKDSFAENTAKVKAALNRHQPLVITGRLPSEKINGASMFHYGYTFDKKELAELLIDLRGLITSDPETSQADKDEIRRDIEKAQMPTGEMWLSTKDYLPYRITFNAANKTTVGTVTSDWSLALDLNLSKYDEPVVVEKPADARPFEEVLKAIFGGMGGDFSSSGDLVPKSATDGESLKFPAGSTAHTDTDKDGIPDDIEEALGTDPKKADTDGDGHNDKEELDNGYNPFGPGRWNAGL